MINEFAMIRNYLKTALRNLKRYKFFTFINIVGFSIGLATCFILFLLINRETGFDSHLSRGENLYRIALKETTSQGIRYYESVPYPLATALRQELLDHEQVVSAWFDSKQIQAEEQFFLERGLVYTDSVFVDLFDVELVQGKAEELEKPGSVLLTRQTARKYFGDQNPMGKRIQVNNHTELTVRGVITNPPSTTHLPYKMLISSKSLTKGHHNVEFNRWGSNNSHLASYVRLNPNSDIGHTEEQINALYHKHHTADIAQKNEFFLVPVGKIHNDGRFDSLPGSYVISSRLIWILALIGLVVLAIALINFINLSIVQAIRRSKEVGLRKVVGATRRKLILQFMVETWIVVTVSVILAIILTEIFLPLINSHSGHMANLSLYSEPDIFVFIVILLVGVSLLGGAFPAVFMSGYRPIEAIRNKITSHSNSALPLHRVLVIVQFFIAQALVISAITIDNQVDYLKTKELGFNKERLMVVQIPHAEPQKQTLFKNRLKEIPNISQVALGMGEPLSGSNNVSNYQVTGNEQDHFANMKAVDQNYLQTYGIELKYGRWFRDPGQASRSDEIVVNETLTRDIGCPDPREALGKTITLFGKKRQVVGVTRDFHVYTLHRDLFPLIFHYETDLFARAGIQLKQANYQQTRSEIETVFRDVFPNQLFRHYIYEDYLKNRYQKETVFFSQMQLFTAIALVLASMGLIGLVSFMMVQRTRDIGIRKTMGALPGGIVYLYTSRFVKLVFLSSLFAWPLAWFFLKNWLQQFAYHIPLHPGYFLAGLLLVTSISLVSILYNTLKVARINPAHSLRNE